MPDALTWLSRRLLSVLDGFGRTSVAVLEEVGYVAALLLESVYWAAAGRWLQQPVRLPAVGEWTISGLR